MGCDKHKVDRMGCPDCIGSYSCDECTRLRATLAEKERELTEVRTFQAGERRQMEAVAEHALAMESKLAEKERVADDLRAALRRAGKEYLWDVLKATEKLLDAERSCLAKALEVANRMQGRVDRFMELAASGAAVMGGPTITEREDLKELLRILDGGSAKVVP